jgi:hypothetical protein
VFIQSFREKNHPHDKKELFKKGLDEHKEEGIAPISNLTSQQPIKVPAESVWTKKERTVNKQ